MRTVPTAVLALLLLLAGAAPATAATAEIERREFVEDGETYEAYTAIYTAGLGEANRLTIEFSEGEALVFEDAGAEIVAGEGCSNTTPGRVTCSPYHAARVTLADGDDTSTFIGEHSARFGGLDVRGDAGDDVMTGGPFFDHLYGGLGDDRILGGDNSDEIRGGEGNDELDGGSNTDQLDGGGGRDEIDAGADPSGYDFITDGDTDASADADTFRGDADTVVSYRDREEDITVDLAAGTGGARGESDIFAGPRSVQGGKGDDRLDGTAGDDFLWGAEGEDVLDSRGGDDLLRGDGGADIYLGGGGDDRFQGVEDNASDVVNCGSGSDFVEGQDARDVLRGSCELAAWYDIELGPSHEVIVRPKVRRRRVTFSVTCGRSRFEPCRGRARLVTPGRRVLLGKGRFRITRKRGRVTLELTRRGRRLVRRGGYVRVVFVAPRCRNCGNPPNRFTGFTTHIRRDAA